MIISNHGSISATQVTSRDIASISKSSGSALKDYASMGNIVERTTIQLLTLVEPYMTESISDKDFLHLHKNLSLKLLSLIDQIQLKKGFHNL